MHAAIIMQFEAQPRCVPCSSPCAGSGHLASCVSSTHVPDIDESLIKFQDCVCQLPTVLLPENAWLVWLMHVVVVRTVCVGWLWSDCKGS
jgi:hypothetical protein